MTQESADFPVREPVVDDQRLVTNRWRIWLRNLRADVNLRSNRLAAVVLDGQVASITTTPFKTATLSGGDYRVSAFTHITTAGTVSSSLLVTVSFTHKTIACALSSAALITNLTTSVQGTVFPITIDAGTPISWSTTYAAVAAGSMAYTISVVLESVNA